MLVISENKDYFGEVDVIGIAKRQPKLIYGKVARELREKKGFSLNDLAVRLKVKENVLVGVENQMKPLTEDLCKKYCEIFDVKKEDFFDLDLDVYIATDKGTILKTYESSEECRKEFDRYMGEWLKMKRIKQDVLIDFSINESKEV